MKLKREVEESFSVSIDHAAFLLGTDRDLLLDFCRAFNIKTTRLEEEYDPVRDELIRRGIDINHMVDYNELSKVWNNHKKEKR